MGPEQHAVFVVRIRTGGSRIGDALRGSVELVGRGTRRHFSSFGELRRLLEGEVVSQPPTDRGARARELPKPQKEPT